MNDETYFDYAAAAPPFPEALRRLDEVSLQSYANPSSTHGRGKNAREALDRAREAFLARLGFHDGRLILTSGATEANNLVLREAMERHPSGRLLLSADAHPSTWFANDLYGKRVDILRTDSAGRIRPEQLEQQITRKTVLVSLLHGNNETGVIQDVKALGAVCAHRKIPLHVDGVQVIGHLPVTLSELPFASYTFSAHKFGGPRGVGGVLAREVPGGAQIQGGGQEQGVRGGTENLAGLAASVVALDLSCRSLETEVPRLRRLARTLIADLRSSIPDVLVNSDPDAGLPGLVSVSFPTLIGEEIVLEMDVRGYEISAGSACGSGKREPSRPLLAMGRSRVQALGTVRISMGRFTTAESVGGLAAALRQVVEKQKALA
ncbi:MAG TPA: aminotransferase class V-fold PLP-dependent enzyme [Planctomycetota bacterium]|nr:aminotransferase class V-fold PLP-dependent enzyme [Planctomycetota bacterium]